MAAHGNFPRMVRRYIGCFSENFRLIVRVPEGALMREVLLGSRQAYLDVTYRTFLTYTVWAWAPLKKN